MRCRNLATLSCVNAFRSAIPSRRRDEIGHIGGRGCIAVYPRLARHASKEEFDRYSQDVRKLLQVARADSIGALLIFLHLLKREAERVRALLLSRAKHDPPHSHAAAPHACQLDWEASSPPTRISPELTGAATAATVETTPTNAQHRDLFFCGHPVVTFAPRTNKTLDITY
jgi:hypothetical protein